MFPVDVLLPASFGLCYPNVIFSSNYKSTSGNSVYVKEISYATAERDFRLIDREIRTCTNLTLRCCDANDSIDLIQSILIKMHP